MSGKSKSMNMNDIVEKGKIEKVKVLLSISTGEINRLFVNSLCEITKSKKYNIEVRMCGENESNASVLEGFSRMEECPFELIIFIKPCVGFSQESIENMIQRTISDKYKKIYGLSVPRGNLAFEHMESVNWEVQAEIEAEMEAGNHVRPYLHAMGRQLHKQLKATMLAETEAEFKDNSRKKQLVQQGFTMKQS